MSLREAATERDHLSALPDDLLYHILRLLDARQAVRDLSLLSRRWRRLWASSPCVTLQSSAGHERFGNSLLLLRDPVELRVLCLDSTYTGHPDPFVFQRRWLRHALSRGLRELELTLCMVCSNNSFALPDSVFTCATLEEINLSCNPLGFMVVIAPKGAVSLPRLKKLHLDHVEIDPSAVEKLNSGCPSLEDLNLERCSLGSFKISSETLKTLSITDCTYTDIHVSAPNTGSLKLVVSGRVHLSAMPSLVSAWVYVSDVAADHLAPSAYHLIAALCNAQHLELFRFDLLIQNMMQKTLAECSLAKLKSIYAQKSAVEALLFSNLKSLYVGEWMVNNFYNPLVFFIQRAPNLSALALDQWKLYQRHNGSLSNQVCREKKPDADGKLKLLSALPRNLETLWIRLSKDDDIEEFRKMRRSLKEKTKPREMEVVWF